MFAILFMSVFIAAIFFYITMYPENFILNMDDIPTSAWVIIMVLGIVNSALAYLTWDYAMQAIGAVNAGIIYYTLPIFTIPIAYLFLNEQVFESQIFGAILIVLGIMSVILDEKQNKVDKAFS